MYMRPLFVQCLVGKEGEDQGRRKRDVDSREVCGLVAVLRQAVLHVPAEPGSQLLLYLLVLHKGMLVDGLHNISEEDL